MAFICSTRLQPGLVRHSSFGLLHAGLHTSPHGPRGADAADDARAGHAAALAALWEDTVVELVPVPDLAHGRWEKPCWNVPFSGLSVAGGGSPWT